MKSFKHGRRNILNKRNRHFPHDNVETQGETKAPSDPNTDTIQTLNSHTHIYYLTSFSTATILFFFKKSKNK
jgi:hypothetical protein